MNPAGAPSILRVSTRPRTIRPGQSWTKIDLPAETVSFFGTKARVSVRMSIGKGVFRTSIMPNGDGTHHVMFNQSMRAEAGKTGWIDGTPLDFELARDDTPRVEPQMPVELADALSSDPAAGKVFGSLAPSHRRAYVEYVAGAKRPATRLSRAERSVRMMREGLKPDF